LTLVCAASYDGPVLSITVPGRRLHLADVRDDVTAIYGAAVRTPLVRLDLSDAAGSPSELYLKLQVLAGRLDRARIIAEGAAGCAAAAALSGRAGGSKIVAVVSGATSISRDSRRSSRRATIQAALVPCVDVVDCAL
jgi:hypothetical protein